MSQQIKSVLILVVAVFVGGAVVFGAMQFQRMQQGNQNSVLAAQAEVASTIKAVSKLMELPSGETPTVATVTDITKLKNQTFFKNAKNGDKVLIYSSSREAILYRPNENKIVAVAPVNIQNPTAVPTLAGVSVSPTATPTIAVKQFPTHAPTHSITPLPSVNP